MHTLIKHREETTSTLIAGALAVASAYLVVSLAVRIMNYDLRRDEALYVPPMRLLDESTLYKDFFYNHVPGSAWWFYGVRQLTGSDHLLMNGRLGVLAGWFIFAAAIGFISFALTRSRLVSWCIVVLSVLNPLFLTETGMTATNNLLPLPFSFLGIGLFILVMRSSRRRLVLTGAAGLCLSVAVVLKISAVAFVPPVAIAAFFFPRALSFPDRIKHIVLPLAIGGLVGGLPILFYLVSDPARFLAHVVGYHTGPHARYWQGGGEGAAVSLAEKVLLARDIWLSNAVAVSLVVVVAMVLTGSQLGIALRRTDWLLSSGPVIVVFAALASSVFLSFVPTPAFPQYFAPPLICLPLILALLFAGLDSNARKQVLPAVVAATIVVLAISIPRLSQFIGTAVHPQHWLVSRVHDGGMAIAQLLEKARVQGKVATLVPIYPLEGGLEVYPELATGPFAYRTADLTPPDLARFYRMTSPTRVRQLLDTDPPAALLLGFDASLEAPLLAYAESNGYVPVENIGITNRYGTGLLYVRPAQGE
ncbi:hypothetical protein [Chelativorans salis]|uniref:Glycosyltransferase RgtA/B/C/D-like domain-containing protein n=1 Tax=Chelativorans salis TaxID=2978478 RepID=A0ABT2LUS8_9HYPH|nr:hypothetical protein [Chelativorans sp. EGI FJ00035]MCT7376939.1 hypothetical protein [Chelativorans sp. EGI FJ00035]